MTTNGASNGRWLQNQILSLEDQTKIGNLLKLTVPQMEDDLKIIKCWTTDWILLKVLT
jgi:hypothetical protein